VSHATGAVKVAVLGASQHPWRYAYRAVELLRARGYAPIGINPTLSELGDVPLVAAVSQLPPGVDTLTMYVAPERSRALADEICSYGFRRVIFNPGSENPALARALEANGVEVLEACTLVLLTTGRF
jgi:predicted CoA-binding protein